jgi:formylglycine-generating enzyme required for sulfatase activity
MSPKTWSHCFGLCAVLIALASLVGWSDDAKKAKKYALLVGVTEYDHSDLPNLKYTENDVDELAKVLTDQKGAAFDEVIILTTKRGAKDDGAKPTAANLRKQLKALTDKTTKHDVLLIGLSGHGLELTVTDPGTKKDKDESFFCPSDARPRKTKDLAELKKTMIPLLELFEELQGSGAGAKLMFVDACRDTPKLEGARSGADVDHLPKPPQGMAVLFACKSGELARETPKLGNGHGVFFYHVIEGLKGKAKDNKGRVTWNSLSDHVLENVDASVRKHVGGGARQTPQDLRNLTGSPVVLVSGLKGDEVAKDKDKAPKEEIVKDQKGFTNSVGMKFVRVKAGKFTMGSPKDEKDRSEDELQHEVELTKDFFLGVTEVTQKQYREVMSHNPSYFSADGKASDKGKYEYAQPGGGADKVKGKDTDDFPVENVSWEDAQDFLKKLNALAAEKKFRVKYRLPTEAEWEYSCRGGPVFEDNKDKAQLPFHFKDPIASLSSDKANFDGNYPYGGADKGKYLERTCKIRSYEENGLGLFDLHGNVWEWCQDWYGADYYKDAKSQRDPTGPEKGTSRVIRGGSWGGDGQSCRAAFRYRFTPADRDGPVGFRVAAGPSSE